LFVIDVHLVCCVDFVGVSGEVGEIIRVELEILGDEGVDGRKIESFACMTETEARVLKHLFEFRSKRLAFVLGAVPFFDLVTFFFNGFAYKINSHVVSLKTVDDSVEKVGFVLFHEVVEVENVFDWVVMHTIRETHDVIHWVFFVFMLEVHLAYLVNFIKDSSVWAFISQHLEIFKDKSADFLMISETFLGQLNVNHEFCKQVQFGAIP